jgi:uncharacterized protein YjbI with pentapeptide repeats
MNFHVFCGCLCLAATIVLCSEEGATAPKKQPSTVEENIERLLKTGSCPSCDLSGADLRQARLKDAHLEGANLTGALLSYTDLSGANLATADLRGADLSGADLAHANFEGANLKGTVFEGALFNMTKIRGRVVNRLIHADQAQTVNREGAAVASDNNQAVAPTGGQQAASMVVQPDTVSENTTRVHAEKTEGAAVELVQPVSADESSNKSPEDVNAAKKAIIERMFEQDRCVGCNLAGVDLSGRDLGGFDLERVDFRGADLRDTDLSKSNLKGAVFQNARLQAADLSKADLYRADFSGADLTGADLDEAMVDGADFSGAIGLDLDKAESEK